MSKRKNKYLCKFAELFMFMIGTLMQQPFEERTSLMYLPSAIEL